MEQKTIEQWCSELSTPQWLFAVAKRLQKWPKGKEVTEDQYKNALIAAQNKKVG